MKQKITGGVRNTYGKRTWTVFGLAQLLLVLLPVFIFGALLLPSVALAGTERFILDYGDSQFRGHHDGTKIYLKKSLKEHYPVVDVSNYRLRKVILDAWTNSGTGNVRLRIGPEMTSIYNVDRRNRDMARERGHSSSAVAIENPFYESWGPWQLLLHGDITLRQVILEVEKRDTGKSG